MLSLTFRLQFDDRSQELLGIQVSPHCARVQCRPAALENVHLQLPCNALGIGHSEEQVVQALALLL